MSKFRNKDNKGTPAISTGITRHSFYVAFFLYGNYCDERNNSLLK